MRSAAAWLAWDEAVDRDRCNNHRKVAGSGVRTNLDHGSRRRADAGGLGASGNHAGWAPRLPPPRPGWRPGTEGRLTPVPRPADAAPADFFNAGRARSAGFERILVGYAPDTYDQRSDRGLGRAETPLLRPAGDHPRDGGVRLAPRTGQSARSQAESRRARPGPAPLRGAPAPAGVRPGTPAACGRSGGPCGRPVRGKQLHHHRSAGAVERRVFPPALLRTLLRRIPRPVAHALLQRRLPTAQRLGVFHQPPPLLRRRRGGPCFLPPTLRRGLARLPHAAAHRRAAVGSGGRWGSCRGTAYRTSTSRRWYANRGWNIPHYAWSGPRHFGLWNGLFLWFLLSHLSRPGSAAFFYNHQNDPGYQQWRADAEQQGAGRSGGAPAAGAAGPAAGRQAGAAARSQLSAAGRAARGGHGDRPPMPARRAFAADRAAGPA